MNTTFKNIVAVLIAVFFGSAVNMGILMIGSYIIPVPAGVDVSKLETLKANMHLFEPKHFIFPFLAHALGTFAGAYLVARMAVAHKINFALLIGLLFLVGGAIDVFMLPAPMWFNAVDLIFAYIPMAYLGGKLGSSAKLPPTVSS